MVYVSSAVAFAVAAINTASVLGYPVGLGDEGLDMRSGSDLTNIKRAAGQAPLPQGTHAPSPTVSADPATAANAPTGVAAQPAGMPAAGALPTVEAILAPQPTMCKVGEAPSARGPRQRLYVKGTKHIHANRPGSRMHQSPPKNGALDMSSNASSVPPAAPPLMPRAAPAGPTQSASATASMSGSGAPATPTPPPGGGPVEGTGKVTTTTHKGRDGKPTVYHIHQGTKTHCFAQPTGAPGGGQGLPGKPDVSGMPPSTAGSGAPQATLDTNKANPKTPPAAGAGATGNPPAMPKLAARYEDLFERYYGELDELD